ncbi:MAG: hypothetical protein IPL42_09665 [Saprospiraceae bacterium]|nr:hypothetical protein [Saprospiraceae bacterium]
MRDTPTDTAQALQVLYTVIANTPNGLRDTAIVTLIDYDKPNLGNDTTIRYCSLSGGANISNIYDTTGYISVIWSTPNPGNVSTGIYTLIVTNAFGGKDTAVINVLTSPTPNAIATPSLQNVCSGSTISLINISGNLENSADYNWTRNNIDSVIGIPASGSGNILGTLTNITNVPVTVTFTITPSLTNGGLTCTGTPITATVIVLGQLKPIITADGPTSFCIGGNVNLTSSIAKMYNWSNGKTTQSISINISGNYIVTLTDENNCTAESSPVSVSVFLNRL